MVEAFKLIHKVVQTEPFSKIVEEELLPGPNLQSDEQVSSTLQWHRCQ